MPGCTGARVPRDAQVCSGVRGVPGCARVAVVVVVVRCLMFALPSRTLSYRLQIYASVLSKNDSHFSGRFLNLSPYCQKIRLFLVNKRMTKISFLWRVHFSKRPPFWQGVLHMLCCKHLYRRETERGLFSHSLLQRFCVYNSNSEKAASLFSLLYTTQ